MKEIYKIVVRSQDKEQQLYLGVRKSEVKHPMEVMVLMQRAAWEIASKNLLPHLEEELEEVKA